ncbi:MAG: formylmethanofuran dehydrogenase [Chloroflexi bacterium]|nr:formylmethanofuran dehydrogenase [Chloroflexota bacterium]
MALHTGKDSPEYTDEVSTVEVSKEDMEQMGLQDGEQVRLRTERGEITIRCRTSAALPQGVVFMPYGPPANTLIGTDTGSTGMPDAKGIEVELEMVLRTRKQ